ncbi:glycine--tRNA ligase subunit beta [Clostridioides mangenotii]|uniref:glycine--tRNA ligase subunit beta n=1 Tax=Metaclostridioides mangenotii TaxID=1540 RepID=UPI001C1259E6|nr:glycine--tRNA ligase subunit beta [Clostridioides mangenotii]MBU5307717.1 glycine--tRNA ligase subunit beta [Clostridioides mangenotii]
MKNYLLFEIGVEEMPARFVGNTLFQLESNLSKLLKDNRIAFDEIKSYGTPRRLVLIVDGIQDKQSDLEEEIKGPAKKIAVDADNNFTKPAIGFMKSKNLNPEDIYFKVVGKDEYMFATIKQKGELSEDIIKEILPQTIKSVVFPKSMRWGGKNLRFVRPIRWLVTLLNDNVVDFDLEGIISSNVTKGHRFLGKSEITVNSLEDYLKKLKENYVILDQKQRKEIIKDQCTKVAEALSGTVELDEELLEEVTHLVEYPTAFYGEFDKDYTKLPKEVVITPMKQHQRYFPVTKGGKLLPNFIAVRNGSDYRIENVKVGNEKVLEARLADALFFYNEDIKNNLESYIGKLKDVVFQAQLGSIYEKTLRMDKLSLDILDELDMQEEKVHASRAAKLSKADLITGMVGEFDELQGFMGKEYAKVSGEDEAVCEAIFEHYLPRFSGDTLPQTNVGVALSIADKLDSIAGFFAIGIQPTGSQDPYALRRQALGILSILMDKKIDVDLKTLIEHALDNYIEIDFDKSAVCANIMNFFNERVRIQFKDMGIRYDVVDAVISSDVNDVYDMYCRALALNNWLDRDELVEMLTAFNRVSTLAQKAESDKVDESLLKEDAERKLYSEFVDVKEKVEALISDKKYSVALETFASLRPVIDSLFDSVMVMDNDEVIKNNRLGLLKQIYDTMLKICDLSKIVYK